MSHLPAWSGRHEAIDRVVAVWAVSVDVALNGSRLHTPACRATHYRAPLGVGRHILDVGTHAALAARLGAVLREPHMQSRGRSFEVRKKAEVEPVSRGLLDVDAHPWTVVEAAAAAVEHGGVAVGVLRDRPEAADALVGT